MITFAISMLIILGVIGVHRYLKEEVFSSVFNPEKMTLNYKRIGHGPKKLILIHGVLGSFRYWEREIDILKNDYDVLMVDVLGFGNSPKPKGRYDLDMHIVAIEKVIKLENFDSGGSVLMGHSFGAILSLAIMAKHPGWFEGAIFIGLPAMYYEKDVIKRMIKQSFVSRITLDKSIAPFVHYPLGFMTKISWLAKIFGLPRDVFADLEKHTWSSAFGTIEEAIMKTDIDAFVPVIKDKFFLFIHGDQDKTSLIKNAKKFASKFSRSKFISFKNSDHHLFLKEPQKVWEIVVDFLNPKRVSK